MTLHLLDFIGFLVGLVYLYLEYRASIWLWLAGVVMPAVDMVLYYRVGLYADFGMACYYCLAAAYGFVVWKWGRSGRERELPVSRFPVRLIQPVSVAFLVIWCLIRYILVTYTDSTVPVTDAFTTALSIVALWALARKFAEQWLLWFVVDLVCCWLYVRKGIPFKAAIYGLYTVVAVLGYRKWLRMLPKA